MPSEALSDGIFYCLCHFVPGRKCLLQHGILVPPFGFSDGIGGFDGLQTALSHPPPSFPRRRESRP
ncbi:hypothetical protein [Neisseria bergeri]|uniref:hypothetical protein n=1 Tax=Neisseria bergeri TaxID=1906581 RepID=UPI00272A84F7|nr:hypothetical protein [Neisseria bergeri]